MKPSLQLKLSQHLALTPQLQQSIRLLQLSTLELNQELEKFLLENPLLEREDEDSYAAAPPPPGSGEVRETASTEDERREHSEENPESEVPRSGTDDEGWPGDGTYGSSSGAGNRDDDDGDYQDIQAATTSLSDHLIW
ncbi:MAG TPA: RNA polymerase factor sigma-54, partial [Thauera aminoaromatica]|nr:RNA polymerase factor sigma-54 [Thauera aminoaromatica]